MLSAHGINHGVFFAGSKLLKEVFPLVALQILLEAPFVGFAGELLPSIPVLKHAK